MLGSPLYHDLLHDSTCMSQVEVGTPLHNFLDFGSYITPIGLYLFQILLYLIFHLSIHLDLLRVYCTEVLDCTMQGYTMDACCYTEVSQCCTEAAQCCTVVANYYMEVVPS
jgi:hypothetical protein